MNLLCKYGSDVNRESKNGGKTPLIEAALHGHVDVVHRLIRAGAVIDYRNSRGKTVIDYASTAGQAYGKESKQHRCHELLVYELGKVRLFRHIMILIGTNQSSEVHRLLMLGTTYWTDCLNDIDRQGVLLAGMLEKKLKWQETTIEDNIKLKAEIKGIKDKLKPKEDALNN